MSVRLAHPDDAAAIVTILDREIRTGVAHFGDAAPSVEDVAARITGPLPWVVWDHNEVLGYASLSPWKERAAYRWSAEVGIYLHPSAQRRGIGRQLVDELIRRAPEHHLHTLIAGMTLPNPGSQALFEGLGFRPVGTFPQVGFKHGRWLDVGYWTRSVG